MSIMDEKMVSFDSRRNESLLLDFDLEISKRLSFEVSKSLPSPPMSLKGTGFAVMSAFIGSVVPLCLMALYGYSNISTYEVVYWEALMLNVINLGNAWYHGQSVIDVPKDMRKLAVLRAFFGGVAFMCAFAAVKFIPISRANILNCTGTLYIPFLAKYFLGEQFKQIDILTLL